MIRASQDDQECLHEQTQPQLRQSSFSSHFFPEVSIVQGVALTIESTLCIPLLSMQNREAWGGEMAHYLQTRHVLAMHRYTRSDGYEMAIWEEDV